MRSDQPSTPRFDSELEARLRRQTAEKRRARRPYAASALRRLRSLSTMAAHTGAAVVVSAGLLILSPTGTERDIELPPIAEPPTSGYLAQYGAPALDTDQTITLAREAGFEVDVITTYVPDRADHGAIVAMQHLTEPVSRVPMNQQARGPLVIVVGLTIGDAGILAD